MEQSFKLLEEIRKISQELEELKLKFTMYQRLQGINKESLVTYDPYDEVPKGVYETEIYYCRFTLKVMQQEIKELRKKLKKLQREYSKLLNS